MIGTGQNLMSGSWNPLNFPNLNSEKYEPEMSRATRSYNCLAFAAGTTMERWEPTEGYFWPPTAPRDETVDAFVKAYEWINYKKCDDGSLEAGFEKIAIFAKRENGEEFATHASRQLQDGRWTSKIGDCEDIVHPDLNVVGGTNSLYGNVVQFMKRDRL